ncbi:MAG: hypothetical protein H7296_12305 [Bacteroidia bacterium]|nr:hypothetical protein [Bacteroidia bacterium]
MVTKNYLETKKTARYFTLNTLSDQTKTILIVIHGYAQTAAHIIENFVSVSEDCFVLAPEGLNRFYSRGFGGTPTANWMTSLERETEIADYIYYFDQLYTHLNLNNFTAAKVIVLGFSQGVSTSSRWVQATSHKIDGFILIAGEIAIEMQQHLPDKIKVLPKAFFIGNNDNLFTAEKVEMMKELLGKKTLFEMFAGKHEINEHCLKLVVKTIHSL